MGHRVLQLWEKKSFHFIHGDQEIPLTKQLSKNLKEKMEALVKISRGKLFQREGTAGGKALT